MSISEINWNVVDSLAHQGKLNEYFKLLTPDQWKSVCPYEKDAPGYSFLHFAARIGNLSVLYTLLQHVPNDVCAFSYHHHLSPLFVAIICNNTKAMELLCATYTFLISKPNWKGVSPLEMVLCSHEDGRVKIAKFLLANGARLKSVKYFTWIHQELRDFEQGVLQSRDVIVVLLGLKKKRVILHKLDRFLIQQELAVAIWSTRQEEEWQK